MKIGILTYHRSHNYGALLQAIATRYFLEKEGHKAYYIDYWPEYHQQVYAFFSLKRLCTRGFIKGLKYLISFISSYKQRREKVRKSESFINQYILKYSKPVTDSFDVVVYGSDQIWRKQAALKDYNPVYFGQNNFKASKHVAFSASMGILPDSDSDREKIISLVSHLDAISVREESLQHMLLQLGLREIYHTLDPTLLIDACEWDKILQMESNDDNEKYALYYRLQSNSFEMSQIRNFAKFHGLKLKVITGKGLSDDNGKFTMVTNPCDFVCLIKHASIIFTSSFHGLAFSIIYGKPFYTSFTKNQGRAESLLNALGIDDCLLPPLSQIPMEYPSINYPSVRENLEELRKDTMKFIKNNIC